MIIDFIQWLFVRAVMMAALDHQPGAWAVWQQIVARGLHR